MISIECLFDVISAIDKKEHSFKELCKIYYEKVKIQEKKERGFNMTETLRDNSEDLIE